MRRSGFLKSLLAVPLVASLSSFGSSDKKTYKIDEIFDIYPGNNNLLYPKPDSLFYKDAIERIKKSDIIIYDESIVYCGLHNIYFPIKNEYSASEIRNLFEKIHAEYVKRGYVINGDHHPYGVVMRLTIDMWEDRYIPDIYIKNSWSNLTQISSQHYTKEERLSLKSKNKI
jgi:hypothetical protein